MGMGSTLTAILTLGSDTKAFVGGARAEGEPTLAAVVLLHLKRMAAIRAVEDHPIERVNGG